MRPSAHPSLGSLNLPTLHGGRDQVLWPALLDLAERMPQRWALIGGQMVALHGLLAGRDTPRVTEDIDLIFDVRFLTAAFDKAHQVLKGLGYDNDEVSADGKAYRYRHPQSDILVDILAPDNLGVRAAPKLKTPRGTIVPIPGGTQALNKRQPLAVNYRDRTGTLFLPNLIGALEIKSKALQDEPPAGTGSRHLDDIAFLVSLIDDPDEFVDGTEPTKPRFGTQVSSLDDPHHECWLRLGHPYGQDGHNAWEILRQAR